jgi:hypothetical protein
MAANIREINSAAKFERNFIRRTRWMGVLNVVYKKMDIYGLKYYICIVEKVMN